MKNNNNGIVKKRFDINYRVTPLEQDLNSMGPGNGEEMRSAQPLTLATANRLGYQLRMTTPVFLIGAGTQGTLTVSRLLKKLREETEDIPRSVAYLTIDGAPPASETDRSNHKALPLLNGAGSDPNVGKEAFRACYSQIRHVIKQFTLNLRSDDPLISTEKTPDEALTFWVIGGNGGVSGGIFHEIVDLCHIVARDLKIKKVRVNTVLFGAEMPMRDITRSPSLEQKQAIQQTTACNIARFLADHHNPKQINILSPSGESISLRACERIWSLYLVDQSNGWHDFAMTDELIELVILTCFSTIFTPLGIWEEDRIADLEKLGTTGRGIP